MKPPSRKVAIAGNGVRVSRDQPVRQDRAFSPRSLAHRRISDAPILSVPSRCLICWRSAATPWKCSKVTRASSPESTCLVVPVSALICNLQGSPRSRVLRHCQHRLLTRLRIGDRCYAKALACRDKARRHELAKQRGTRPRAGKALDHDIVAGSAVENVLPAAAEQNVVAVAAGQGVVAEPADQDVIAVAAIAGDLEAGGKTRCVDDIVAAEAVDH